MRGRPATINSASPSMRWLQCQVHMLSDATPVDWPIPHGSYCGYWRAAGCQGCSRFVGASEKRPARPAGTTTGGFSGTRDMSVRTVPSLCSGPGTRNFAFSLQLIMFHLAFNSVTHYADRAWFRHRQILLIERLVVRVGHLSIVMPTHSATKKCDESPRVQDF